MSPLILSRCDIFMPFALTSASFNAEISRSQGEAEGIQEVRRHGREFGGHDIACQVQITQDAFKIPRQEHREEVLAGFPRKSLSGNGPREFLYRRTSSLCSTRSSARRSQKSSRSRAYTTSLFRKRALICEFPTCRRLIISRLHTLPAHIAAYRLCTWTIQICDERASSRNANRNLTTLRCFSAASEIRFPT